MDIAERTLQLKTDFDEVYEAGKKAEHSDFWDVFQSNGNRTNYYRAFANHNSASTALGWNSITFRPKYDLKPSTAPQGFMWLQIGDFDAHLKECGIIFDTSKCDSLQQAFQSATITVFPTLHLKDDVKVENMFNLCSKLTTIRKIIFEINTDASLSYAFSGCSKLANIEAVEGTIPISVSFSSSPLSIQSLKNIISCLKDYTGDSEYTCTVTFKSSEFSALEAEGATAEYNGVACTWAELIDNKKWNLVKG